MQEKSLFRKNMSQKLGEFKRAYRSNLSPVIRKEMQLSALNITRKQTQNMSDIELYRTCCDMIEKIQCYQSTKEKRHLGLDAFAESLEKMLGEYCIFDEKVVHQKSFCSKHILNIIQHTQTLQMSINNRSLHAIKESGKTLIEFGEEDAIDQLISLMNENEGHSMYFERLATYFTNLKKAYDDDPLAH